MGMILMQAILNSFFVLCFVGLAATLAYQTGFAQEIPVTTATTAAALAPAAGSGMTLDTGSTAWMLTSALLVLMMTLPGLALFYGGMVHKESVLATLMQAFVATTLVSILWCAYGYSLIFTEHNGFIWSLSKVMMHGIGVNTLTPAPMASVGVPESVYVVFQMTFSIITCALIFGSVATRIKFSSAIVFIALWFTLVYCPIAHWVWGPKGVLGGAGIDNYKGLFGYGGALDFAGGTVVHINAGIAGLMAAIVLGKRKTFNLPAGEQAPPYNIVLSIIGASLLWVGWFGFNAGSAIAANGNAGMAMLVTHVATAAASLAWMTAEWLTRGKPSVIGIISGAVAGLVAITPASGFVDFGGSLVIGIAAGVLCFWACSLKFKFGFDDSLDVFGVHCIGGIIGALLTGIFAVKAIGGADGGFDQLLAQLGGVVCTIVWCGIVSFIILKVIDAAMGLRVDEATEHAGLDLAIHGEKLH
ncbi:MAG: ammonium transporter [Pseudomonadota bacterium]|nr:ammonium transporter [Pseudomonadota bacterium]